MLNIHQILYWKTKTKIWIKVKLTSICCSGPHHLKSHISWKNQWLNCQHGLLLHHNGQQQWDPCISVTQKALLLPCILTEILKMSCWILTKCLMQNKMMKNIKKSIWLNCRYNAMPFRVERQQMPISFHIWQWLLK